MMNQTFRGVYEKNDRDYTESARIRGEHIAERMLSFVPEHETRVFYTISLDRPGEIIAVKAEKTITKNDARGSISLKVSDVSDLPDGNPTIAAAILTNLCSEEQQTIKANAEEAAAALRLLAFLPSALKRGLVLCGRPSSAIRFSQTAIRPLLDEACLRFCKSPGSYAAAFTAKIEGAAQTRTLTSKVIRECLEQAVGKSATLQFTRPKANVADLGLHWNQNPLTASVLVKYYGGECVTLPPPDLIWESCAPEMIADHAMRVFRKPWLADVLPLCTGTFAELDSSLRAFAKNSDDSSAQLTKGFLLAYHPYSYQFCATSAERYACVLQAYLFHNSWRARFQFCCHLRHRLSLRERSLFLIRLIWDGRLRRSFPFLYHKEGFKC